MRLVMLLLMLLLIAVELATGPSALAAPPSAVRAEASADGAAARLVFAWSSPTTVRVARAGRTVRLLFGSAVTADLLRPRTELGGWLRGLRTTGRTGEVIIELAPDTHAELLSSSAGTVVLGLSRDQPRPAREAARPTPVPRADSASPVLGGPARRAAADTPPAPAKPQRKKGARSTAAASAPPPAAPSAARPAVPLLAALAPAAGPEPAAAAATAAPTAAPAGAAAGTYRLRWRRPVPAAAFERGGVLWLVFGAGPADLVEAGLPDQETGLADRELPPVTGHDHYALRLVRGRAGDLRVRREGAAWLIGPHQPEAAGIQAEVRGDRLALAASGHVVRLTDPDSGEVLHVLLTEREDLRSARPLELVDLELLPTLVGLAWRVLADDVEATLTADRLELGRAGGLRLASRAPHDPPRQDMVEPVEQPSRPTVAAAGERLLGFAGLAKAGPLAPRRAALTRELGRLAPGQAVPVRLELARLLIGEALGAEALALLEAEPGPVPPHGAGLALRAAAGLLLGRPDRAAALLAELPATADPELALWRAATQAGLGRWDEADRLLQQADRVWTGYPPRLGYRLGLVAAGILAQAGRIDAALAAIDQLEGTALITPEELARLRLIRGLVLTRDGDADEAAQALAAADRDGDLATRILARFLATEAALSEREITPEEALDRLAAQRLLWRGHPDELRMLTALGDLERAQGNAAAALASWDTALARAPRKGDDEAASVLLLARMRETLTAALGGASDPITALDLYRRYGAVLAGTEDAVHRSKLAQRLAELGLPGLAASLTERGLKDDDAAGGSPALGRARRLLEAGDPVGALALILPGRGGGAERLLRAQALLHLDRPAEASAELAGLKGPAARDLRADALWRAASWQAFLTESGGADAVSPPDAEAELRRAVARLASGGDAGPAAGREDEPLLALLGAAGAMDGDAATVVAGLESRLAAMRTAMARVEQGRAGGAR